MAAAGQQAIAVGAFPGVEMYTTTITSATCTSSSNVEAWIIPKDTSDHTLDEHLADPPYVQAHSPASGSFSVTLRWRDAMPASGDLRPFRIFGSWNVGWVHD